MQRRNLIAAGATALLCMATGAWAQGYPNRPVRLSHSLKLAPGPPVGVHSVQPLAGRLVAPEGRN